MYSAKVSSDMIISKKNGEVKLNELDVSVDGYSEPSLLEKAKSDYNSDKDLTKSYAHSSNDWPKGTWYELYYGMLNNMLKWKRKRIYKKN